jgi:WD40 repeat protein/tRNA A-37 threonylcarbamoyl transferase component Bud32
MDAQSAEATDREQRANEVIAAYLAAAEAGQSPDPQEWLARHPDLADELTSFLAAKASFEQQAGPLIPTGAGEPTPGSRPLAPGETREVGDYVLLAEIARGGMGVVYRAWQKSLGRTVAVKMIRAGELASAEDLRRFRAEAELAAGLDHPHIVPVYEVGEHEGQPFFSMKFVEGGSLAGLTTQAGTTDKERQRWVAGLVATVARAVHHAHQRGLLHRDLKPGNILLDEQGRPHVTDFGLAKRVSGEAGEGGDLTRSHAVVGTAAYMPPEQAAGRARQLTTAADVYSLGAILYELLTGRPPFRGETVLDTLQKVRDEEPARPRALAPQLSADLETVCLTCLNKDPARRYGSAEALADDLERWLRGEPIQSRPTGRAERLWRWCRRNPVVAALSAAVVALLVAVSVVASAAAFSLNDLAEKERDAAAGARTARDTAEKRRRSAEAEKRNAETERDAKVRALAQAEGLRLTAHAAAALNTDPGLGLLLAVEGARRAPGLLANNALLAALDACREERTFPPDPGRFTTVRFSADGRRALAVLHTGGVLAWDLAGGRKEADCRAFWQSLRGHFASAVFSPDGRLFAVTYAGNLDVTHDVPNPKPGGDARTYLHYTDRVVRVGELATGKQVALLKGHKGRVVTAAFSPDGKRILTASRDGTARVWDVATGRELLVLRAGRLGLHSAQFSPDGRRILTLTTDWQQDSRYLEREATNPAHVIDPPDVEDPADPAVVARRGKASSVGGQSDPYGGGVNEMASGAPKVFDTATGRLLATLERSALARYYGDSRCTCAAFSPDGERVFTGRAGFAFGFVWEAATGKVLTRLRDGEFHTIVAAVFSPDGSRLAAVIVEPDDKSHVRVRVWDPATGKEVARTDASDQAVQALRFSPDGRLLLAADGRVARAWDAATGREVACFRGHNQAVNDAAFSPDGKRVLTASDDGTVRLWRLTPPPGAHVVTVRGGHGLSGSRVRGPVRSVAFSPDGRLLLTTGDEAAARLWDAATGEPAGVLLARAGLEEFKDYDREQLLRQAVAARFTPDGRRLLVLNRMAKVTIKLPGEQPALVPFTPARLFDLKGRERAGYRGDRLQVGQAILSPDGRHLLTVEEGLVEEMTYDGPGRPGGPGGTVHGGGDPTPTVARLYEAATGQELAVLRPPPVAVARPMPAPAEERPVRVTGAAFSPDGRRVATVGNAYVSGDVLHVWEVPTGRLLRTVRLEGVSLAGQLWWSPDGRLLLTHLLGSGALLWDADTGRRLTAPLQARFCADLSGWTSHDRVAFSHGPFSPDGRRLAGVGPASVLQLLDARTGEVLALGKGHLRPIRDIAFSPDGTQVVTASEDETARVWNAATGEEVVSLTGHRGAVLDAAFSLDGRRVATASADGTVRVWRLDLLAAALARRPRELTSEERQRFRVDAAANP